MYGYKRKVNLPFEKVVTRVKEELTKEGFGVLTEVDVKTTLKKKLNVEFDDYIILGACNPPFAYRTLQLTKDAGLMMPCNVVVYSEKGNTFIECAMPTVLAGLLMNEKLNEVAGQIESKLIKVIDNVS